MTPRQPLRIACFAFAEEHSGSVSSANFLMLRELLKRGHQIDFFNKRTFLYPEALTQFPNFRYVDTHNKIGEFLSQWLNKIPTPITRFIAGRIDARTFARIVVLAMRREHREKPYDLQLFLGITSYGRLANIRTVSWVQGPPMTDGYSIPRHKQQIVQLCGRLMYLQLRAYAWWRGMIGLPPLRNSDYFITGSSWSCGELAKFGVARERAFAIPYPIDLEAFVPNRPPALPDEPSVLWLGRIVPRKRLDLFLNAAEMLIERGVKLRLTIIGGFAFVPGYRKLIDAFKFPDRLTYKPSIERTNVCQLMSQTDLVLQPSECEDFASTPAEALACGVPVVIGPTNGTRDYTDNAAIVFDRYDATSVADAVEQMLKQIRQAPAEVADRSRATAERHFRLAGIVDQLEAILYDALPAKS
ncbi:hypothetical protein BH10PLA1_BH10PLA1_03440 [soil metagenome]